MTKELTLIVWDPKLFFDEISRGWTLGSIGTFSIVAIILLILLFDDSDEGEAQKKILRRIESMGVVKLFATSILCLVVVMGMIYVFLFYN